MAVHTLEVFLDEAIAKSGVLTKEFNVSPWLGDHEIAGMAYSLATASGTVTVEVQGSFDGKTWNTAVGLLSNVASDGAADFFTAKDLTAIYPWLKFTATEDGVNTIDGFTLLVGLNSVQGGA